jgi:hypothetical protein
MDVDDVKLPPPTLSLLTLSIARLAKRLGHLVRWRDELPHQLTCVAAINKRARQVANTFRPHEIKSVEINLDSRRTRPHGVVKTRVQKLHLIDRRVPQIVDGHPPLQPVLAKFFETFDDLVPPCLTG